MNVYLKKRGLPWQKVIIGTLSVAVVLLLLNVLENPIRNVFARVFSPAQMAFWRAGDSTSSFVGSFLNASHLQQENNSLKEQNQQLLTRQALLQQQIQESKASAEVMRITEADSFSLKTSSLIGLDAVNGFMDIGVGSGDGIAEGMPVISSQKVIIGRVSNVYNNFSRVALISNPESTIDVKIQHADESSETPTDVHGAVKGSGNLVIFLDLVASDAKIQEGDVLITSALEGSFPKGLLVGKVGQISQNDQHPFQSAKIQPFLDVKTLDTVFVVTNYKR